MAAVVVLLAAALLLHVGLPHHSSAAPSAVSAMAPAIESEPRKPQGSVSAATHVGTGSQHHEAAADALALPPRTDHSVEPPSLADDASADETITSLVIVSGMPHPRAARDAWNPGAGLAPDPTVLQTFRC
ncbi:hypothetical protein OOK29_24185 [Streptomyces phaeochromogenes]|uniref:hypothetical protein n=1 Tax=Streptomyces phaeochromogenes TaxID=1923 RepID=UPI002257CF5C|nr:hypothetical protein [Streptomyces phaeochromogenes]MCX5601248.1 hypothetical protein [Streptomyces phaeochromogenes]